ncbi:phosphoribosyltransferase family protein [Bizionia sediminis]|uniref:Phosphoribosyltransferase family protein n=1 Tax=Bizionia sediminis TaxID=1737064 RepID=A0ABW5KVV9_9FLAO
MEISNNNRILNHDEIVHKIRRIAYQIYEHNVNEASVVLAGIDKNGFLLAERLQAVLSEISPIKPVLCRVYINKRKPLDPITTSVAPELYTNQSVVLIDDVLNSGTTLAYGVRHFLNVPLKQFKTAVLVNRNHKKYPVKADFKGISLSTSLHEHVSVNLENDQLEATLA